MHQMAVVRSLVALVSVTCSVQVIRGNNLDAEACRSRCDSQVAFFRQFKTLTTDLDGVYKGCIDRWCPGVLPPAPVAPTTEATTATTSTSTSTTRTTILSTILTVNAGLYTTSATQAPVTTKTSSFQPTSTMSPASTIVPTNIETTNSTIGTITTKSPFGCGIQRGPTHNHRQRIVGGMTAAECEYPWLAFISVLENVCAGAVLDRRHVLTAAHCVSDRRTNLPTRSQVIHVRVGSSYVSQAKVYSVVQVIIHPQHDPAYKLNDAAILNVSEDFVFSDCLSPICLPKPGSEPSNADTCVVAGWGATVYGSREFMPVLQEIQVPIVDQRLCQGSYGQNRVNDRSFCAGDYYSGGKDSCQGDSGAPLMCRNRTGGCYMVYGIVSSGYNCAQRWYPGIYTKVSHPDILEFIYATIGNS